MAEYHYTIPSVYLYFLRRMGKYDSGYLWLEESMVQ